MDRIACPWLFRRFVDPEAVFLFVAPAEVMGFAERCGATPSTWRAFSGRIVAPSSTFDVVIEELGLSTPALDRLARIVRGADTARLDLAPENAGPLAASLGLSRMHKDDLVQLEAVLALYDSFFRWVLDAHEETHHWPATAIRHEPACPSDLSRGAAGLAPHWPPFLWRPRRADRADAPRVGAGATLGG